MATLLIVIGCAWTTDWSSTIESIRMEVLLITITQHNLAMPHLRRIVPSRVVAAAVYGPRAGHTHGHGGRHS